MRPDSIKILWLDYPTRYEAKNLDGSWDLHGSVPDELLATLDKILDRLKNIG